MKKTILAAVAAIMAASPVMAADLGSGLSVNGEIIANTEFNSSKNITTGNTTKSVLSAVDRAYLGVRYEATPIWSLNFKTEFRSQQNATGAALATSNVVRVKEANVEGRFSDAMVVKLGSAELPLVTFEDKAWGHRYIMPGLGEATTFAGQALADTSDYGIHFSGLVDSIDVGAFNYSASVVQGGGYLNNKTNKSGHIDYELLAGFDYDGVTLTAGYRSGYNGVSTQVSANKRYNFSLGYTMEDVASIGVEYISSEAGATKIKSKAFSVYGSSKVSDALDVVVRYDRTDPNDNLSNDEKNLYLVGLEHAYSEAVKLAFTYDYAKDKTANTKDWNLGIAANMTF